MKLALVNIMCWDHQSMWSVTGSHWST